MKILEDSAPKRVLVTGGPKVGKTTYSKTLGTEVIHTDDYISKGWSEGSEEVSKLMAKDYKVIEGVAIPRALRKYLKDNPNSKPCDQVIYIKDPRVPLSKGQVSMAKGVDTVWQEILPELKKRGVEIKYQ